MTNDISFPNLGLNFSISKVAFSFGSITVMWYALMILTGAILGTVFCCVTGKKRGVTTDTFTDILLYGLITGIIGARLYYIAFDFDEYKGHLIDIFKIWEGGLAIYGGLIGAIISTVIYCKVRKLPTLHIIDCCTPGLLIGQAIGRYGNFFNCEVYGVETSLPWGMSINGIAPVHPLFLYESLWNILGLILLCIFRDKKRGDGQVFFGYIIWYSLGRFFLEGLRQNEYILWLIKEEIAVSQAFAILLIIIGVCGMIIVGKKGSLAQSSLLAQKESTNETTTIEDE